MGAEIEVHNCMYLTGRGAVLIGFVRSGTPSAGQATEPLSLGGKVRALEVIAVERLSSMGSGLPAVGLVFRHPPALDELRAALPDGSIMLLENPAQAG